MKHKALSALIVAAMLGGGASVATAQDGSWYLAPRVGIVAPDSNRDTIESLLHRPRHRLVGESESRDRWSTASTMPTGRKVRSVMATSGKASALA